MNFIKVLRPKQNYFKNFSTTNSVKKSTKNDEPPELLKIDDSNQSIRRIVMVNKWKRNVLGIDMIRTLQNAVDTTDLDKARALVISSNCPYVFSSGKL
jgi:enoyl-CoA hydratase/carnithine racemase